jgi:hypothetical protein
MAFSICGWFVAASAGFVQRIFEQHVRRGDFVDDSELDTLALEFGEPSSDDGLVVLFLAHGISPGDCS